MADVGTLDGMPNRAPLSPAAAPLTLVDLFAGSGGLSLGLELAGFAPVFVSEIDRSAMETYLINRTARFPHLREPECRVADIAGVTGDPHRLTDTVRVLRSVSSTVKRDGWARAREEIDLVVGGPPCQGFSRIGHRRTFRELSRSEVPSNHLFEHMARFIEASRPRMFLFENVRGLKSGRWTPHGSKGEIWSDVRARFRSIDGYHVRDTDLLAREYGVPQHRPRVFLVGIRGDVAQTVGWRSNSAAVADGLLPEPTRQPAWDPVDFLGDLVDVDYRTKAATTRYPTEATTEAQCWYRRDACGRVARQGALLTDHAYSQHSAAVVAKFEFMLANRGAIPAEYRTRKFAQRVLPARWPSGRPNVTATSLPDDFVHFAQPRILTVREWARFQTFPDDYEFAGPRTTGGRRRAGDPAVGDWTREVPKYTQIGNAVPVLLAKAIGDHFRTLLS